MRLRSGVTFSGTHSVTLIAQRRADHRVGDAGVAGGGVEDHLPGRELRPTRSPSWIIRSAGPVLHRAAGVLPLGFRVQLDAGHVALDAPQADERRVADQVDDRRARRLA